MDYRGKVAVITGAASGLGLGLTRACAARGMKMALADINETGLGEVQKELSEHGLEILAEKVDVSQVDDVERFAYHTFKHFGQVNLLFNNAGILGKFSTLDAMLKDWEWVIGVNMWGVIHGIRAFVPRMLTSGKRGRIVNIAGSAGFISMPGSSIYRMTKSAVISLSESLYHEMAIAKTGIKVSVVSPAFINTDIIHSEKSRPADMQKTDPIPTTNPMEEAIFTWVKQQVESGPQPEIVAEDIFSGIDRGKLYIFTPSLSEDRDLQQAIRYRSESILFEKNPINPFSGIEYD
ncbi:MAG: SDR family NAD(P)-dependent oxidoreductase [Syntrophomonadaceae bacterium]